MTEYNGHPSWNAWNVALWIGNDEPLYRAAVAAVNRSKTFDQAVDRFYILAGITSDTDSNRPFNIFQVFGDVVKIVGNHSLKMGVDARENRDSNQGYGSSQGVYTFGNTWTRSSSTASGTASVGRRPST